MSVPLTIQALWGHTGPYNDYSRYIRKLYGKRTQKIGLDAGFSCPNRDGTLGFGGCSYCSVSSFSPSYQRQTANLENQIEEGIRFFGSKYGTDCYLGYFQSYTSSHGDLERLREVYEIALAHPSILGIIIGTRPDCVSEGVVSLLGELKKKWNKTITLELGIESTLDHTLERINRGHKFVDSRRAIERLVSQELTVHGHLILGLPGESRADQINHATNLNALPISGLKIHHLQILKGTSLARDFPQSDLHLYTQEEYLELLWDFIPRLRPELVLERFINEAPKDQVLAPHWGGIKNYAFVASLVTGLENRGLYQGAWNES